MLLTKTHAFASAAFLALSIGAIAPAGSDTTDLKTLLAELSTPLASPASASGAEVNASQALVKQLYPTVEATRPAAPDISSQQGLSGSSKPAAAINPFDANLSGMVKPVETSPAANPFSAVPEVDTHRVATTSTAAPVAFAVKSDVPSTINDTSAAAGAPTAIDESALRYYADQRNLERVGAEIRRLKSLNPQWSPPADLFAPKSVANEQPVWDLFGAGRYAEAREAIAELAKATPAYRPSNDLVTKLDQAEARAAIAVAAKATNWTGVIAAADKAPGLLICQNMDALWNVGEAFAKTGDPARSFDLYAYILANCDVPAERLATVQKAALILPPQGLDALTTHGRTLPDGTGEFDSMRFEPLRAEIGKAIGDDNGLGTIDPSAIERFATYVRQSRSAVDAALLGWLSYGEGKFDDATEWFALASSIDPNAKNIEGTVLSLRNRGDSEKARQIAWQAHTKSPELSKIYIELVADALDQDDSDGAVKSVIDPAELKRFQGVVDDTHSALGAQTFGWYLVDKTELADAGNWFRKSVEWEPSEEAVVGLAVVASRTKDRSGLKAIKAEWNYRYPALSDFQDYRPVGAPSAKLRTASNASRKSRSANATRASVARRSGSQGDKAMKQAQAMFDSGQYEQALALIDKQQTRTGKTYGSEILKGWTNVKLKRWDEAERIFRTQDSRRSTKDTRFGIGAVQNSKYNQWPESHNDCTVKWKC